jgi:glutaredoxin
MAKKTLMEQGLEPIEINIDTDPQLFEKFKHCVPVVEIDGKIRFRGHVHRRLLKRIVR